MYNIYRTLNPTAMTERDEERQSFYEQGKNDKKAGKYNPPPAENVNSHIDSREQQELEENLGEYDRGYEEK